MRSVAHVYGSPYGMGYAHGSLLKTQIQKILPGFYAHVEAEVEQYLEDLPKGTVLVSSLVNKRLILCVCEDLRDFIAELGLDAALDVTHILTDRYTPSHFIEELHGLADGSGVDYQLLLRVHMLPELVKVGDTVCYR